MLHPQHLVSSLVFIVFTNFILQSHLGSLFVKLLLLFTVSKTFAERSWWCCVSSNQPIPFHCINDLLTDSSKTNYEWMTGQRTIWLTINDCLAVTKDRHQWHWVFIANNITVYRQSRPITSYLSWPINQLNQSNRVNNQSLIPSTAWHNSLWLSRWLPHRLSKRQSVSTTTVLFRTTFTQMIIFNLLMKWLLVSNLSQF